MFVACLFSLLYLLPLVGLLACLRLPLQRTRWLTQRWHLAAVEAVFWVAGIQFCAEHLLVKFVGEHLFEGLLSPSVPPAWGLLLRVLCAVPVFVFPFIFPVGPWVGLLGSLAWAVVMGQSRLIELSSGVAVPPPMVRVSLGLFEVTPISMTYFLVGAMWYLSVQRMQGQLPPLLSLERVFKGGSEGLRRQWATWMEMALLYAWLAYGLILASAGLMATQPVRIAQYNLVLFFDFASILLCFGLLWRGNADIRDLLKERERVSSRQISHLEYTVFMRQQQICRMLSGANAGAVFWQAQHAHMQTGSQNWRRGIVEFRADALTFPVAIHPRDNLEVFFRKCLPVREFTQLAAALDGIFLGQDTQFALELEGCHVKGGRPRYKIYANAMRSQTGPGILYCDILLLDFKAEHDARSQFQTAAETRQDTLLSVGHDLGSPLGLIRISSSLMKRHLDKLGLLDTYVKRQVARIEACVMEAHLYLKNAIDFAQSDQIGYRFPVKDIQPGRWLASLIENQALIYGVCASRVRLEVPEPCCLKQIQEQAFQMVATNLVSNAFKYGSQGGGSICVRLSFGQDIECRDSILFEVIDEGSGIPDEIRDHLYAPFRRGQNTANVRGTGLGLSIVRRGVQCMNGHIELVKVPVGTHFRISIPLVSEKVEAEVPA